MDNRVILSVGVFVGVAIAAVAWMMTSTPQDPATAGAAVDAPLPEAVTPEERRERLLGDRKLVKRQNTQQIEQSVGADGKAAALSREVRDLVGDEPTLEEPAVYGVDEESVKAARDARMEDLVACYETALFHTPELEGQMTLTLQLEPVPEQDYATVGAVQSDSTFDAPVFEGCIATVFEELHFEVTEPTTLRWPVQFSPGDEDSDEGEGDAAP